MPPQRTCVQIDKFEMRLQLPSRFKTKQNLVDACVALASLEISGHEAASNSLRSTRYLCNFVIFITMWPIASKIEQCHDTIFRSSKNANGCLVCLPLVFGQPCVLAISFRSALGVGAHPLVGDVRRAQVANTWH